MEASKHGSGAFGHAGRCAIYRHVHKLAGTELGQGQRPALPASRAAALPMIARAWLDKKRRVAPCRGYDKGRRTASRAYPLLMESKADNRGKTPGNGSALL
jgi:hypothetical protein